MRNFARSLLLSCTLLVASRVVAAPVAGWNKGQNGECAISLCRDRSGEMWAGTEDNGVSHLADGKWQRFTSKDGLGDDNAYALVCDRLGRIWAGHLNHGVSVWNGKSWKNYGVLDGPLGERIYSIATSPVDGDVWIAHNAGLTRYSLQNDTWTHFTLATGLPTIELSALAFDSLGDLVLGTQHDGVLIGKSEDNFTSWTQIKGASTLPLSPVGSGLPSNFVNDVLVSDDDTIFVATDTGLARSSDFGETWNYLRGIDWEDKVKGLSKPTASQPFQGNLNRELLREDYVTNLAEDQQGLLWLGYRQKGYEVRRPKTDRTLYVSAKDDSDKFPYISTLLPMNDGTATLAYYGEGVSTSEKTPPFFPTKTEKIEIENRRGWKLNFADHVPVAPFPKAAGVPSLDELASLLKLVQNRAMTPADASPIVALPDDWTTQDDWRGRYGKYWANLNAMLAPNDYVWGAGKETIYYAPQIGTNAAKDDALRYWVHWLYTDNCRSLEMPTIYFHSRLLKKLTDWPDDLEKQKHRRQSEWDDHGEAYPMSQDGPNVNVTLSIPPGLFYLSLYNHNKDGHSGFNRARDYKISIRPHDYQKSPYDIKDFDAQPELVQGRWRDFWGGNYKKYMVKGPRELTIQVSRNYSFNTILADLFLDDISEEPDPYFDKPASDFKALKWSPAPNVGTKEDSAAEELWAALETSKTQDPLWWGSEGRLFYQALARFYSSAQKRTATEQTKALWSRIGTSFYQLNLFPEWETMQEKRGLRTARAIEKALEWDQKSNFNGKARSAITNLKSQE